MSDAALKRLYGALLLAGFAAVAFARFDLVERAWQASAASWAMGGWVRAKLAGEILLFSSILTATWLVVPGRVRPARDATAFAAATLAGALVEALGTRAGWWTYYTGERPPWWIVPAWPLGALLIDRAAGAAREAFGGSEDAWVFACGCSCVFFADLWGTTNGCWTYPALPGLRGIAFGMLLDTTVVALCLRAARRAEK